MSDRHVLHITASKPTIEGAGVHLHRAFGYNEVPQFDPFLLLDDFGSDDPHDYLMGFPWHPHRGIETVTYMLEGEIRHEDSLGNAGTIVSGDVQWMSAGSGIVHQEMPEQYHGRMRGFQLWINLPSEHKMSTPRYQGIAANDIPIVHTEDGNDIRVICGSYQAIVGPVHDGMVSPEYLDISIPPDGDIRHSIPKGRNAFAYIVSGQGVFGSDGGVVSAGHLVHFSDGDAIYVSAVGDGVRFLCISGVPLGEPVSWRGPIVMNTPDEIRTAFEELQNGTFIKHHASLS